MIDKTVLSAFGLSKNSKIIEYGEGHIHNTYLVDKKYILQKINNYVFKNVDVLMENITYVLDYLNKNNIPALKLNKTIEGQSYYKRNNEYWRLYDYVQNSKTYQEPANNMMMFNVGYSFGKFISDLSEVEHEKIVDTIPNFHIIYKYYDGYLKIKEQSNKKNSCQNEIEFVEQNINFIESAKEILNKLPKRIVHYDTKINNILFNKSTNKPLMVIDIDTISNGFMIFDFADIIRFSGNQAKEDEEDLSKVKLNIEYYKECKKGFLMGAKNIITDFEKQHLLWGCQYLALENAIRFLSDYLNGDKYYTVTKPMHNLIRARTQMTFFNELKKYSQL